MKPQVLRMMPILGIVILIVSCAKTSRENITVADSAYPQAEWSRAASILMHTPGHELFDAEIHPAAGLFEKYFNVDSAAQEHRAYIELLRSKGVEVYTVMELLRKADVAKLRALASRSLKYDGSHIEDSPSDLEAYRRQILGEMSREDLIRCILLRPTVELYHSGNNTNYEAKYVHNPLSNLYFMRDQSITTPRGHIICNMNSTQRAAETDVVELCYEMLGEAPIYRVSGNARLEGGDYIPAGTIAYLGCGMRTNQEAIDSLLAADVIGHDTLVVCRDHKFWQMQMHLDTYFNVIDRDLVTMVESRLNAKAGEPEYVTLSIYAREHSAKDYGLVQDGIGMVDFLKDRGVEIIGIAEKDELHYANNFLTIAPRHIVAVGGQSEELQNTFEVKNVKVEWLDLECLIGGYGAAHCMTQVLSREPMAE